MPNFPAILEILKPAQQYFSVAKFTHSQERQFSERSVNRRGVFTIQGSQSSARSSILLNEELGDSSILECEQSLCEPNLSMCLISMIGGSNRRKLHAPSISTDLYSIGAPK